MAIQIRRGTNTEWENNNPNIVVGEPAIVTDAERFFVGTASGDYAEFANLDIIAPAHDTSASYVVGDVINRQGKLYSCNTPCSGTFNASYWDEKSLAEILKDLENEIDYAQYEIGYADGELITIDNGASEIPVKDLTLDIEAVQDLHGYDYPWVGGAGKNLLEVTGTSSSHNGITYTVNSDSSGNVLSITAKGTASAESIFNIKMSTTLTASCILTGCPSGGSTSTYSIQALNSGSTGVLFTDTGSGATLTAQTYGRFRIRVASGTALPTAGIEFKPMIRLSSVSDATYEPYSNICPISGWDEVNVNVAGKNLFGLKLADYADAISYGLSSYKSISVPNGVYTISTNAPTGYIWGGDKIDSGVSYIRVYSGNPHTITVDAGLIYIGILTTDKATALSYNIQIERGSTATEYEPYNGQTYTTDLNSTRYGGTLDVTTGVLTITHSIVDLGTLSYAYSSSLGFYANMSDAINPIAGGDLTAICSNYKRSNYPQGWENGCFTISNSNISTAKRLFINDSRYSDTASFKTAMSGVQLVYELATKQVVQLTPTQVRTLLGTNNLWNQMNSNNELAYRISNALN